jgi:phosphoglycolate phosphatase-like HAD superfamily hydrolase
MNLVGKIFVVLIFVMSLVFMSFAVAVYATHRNWREVVLLPREQVVPGKEIGLKFQLDEAKVKNDGFKNELDKVTRERDAEKTARIDAVAKLENELKVRTKERNDRDRDLAALVQSERNAVAAMNATQAEIAIAEKERSKLRTEVLQAQKDRDAHFKEVQRLLDELHQAANDKVQLQNRLTTLAQDLAKAKEALRYYDINENSDYKAKAPPRVDGVILATPGDGLVEVSLGSDDGLRKGHQLEVYRISGGASTYVGRIEVVKTAPNLSVCKLAPNFPQNSNIMKGDRVASKIE